MLFTIAPTASAQMTMVPGSAWNVDFGRVNVSPSVVMSNGSDSNVLRTGGSVPISSYEFFTIPQVDATIPIAHYRATGTAAVEYAYTPAERSSKKSAVNNYLEGTFGSPDTVLKPMVTIYRLSTYARSELELGSRSQRNNRTIDAGLGWAPGRFGFRGGFTQIRTRFDAAETFKDVSLAEKLNFDFWLRSFDMGFALTPMLGVSGHVESGDYNFVLAPLRNGKGSRITGGVVFTAPAALVGSVALGLRDYRSNTEADVKVRGLTADAALQYVRPTARALVAFYRDIGFSWDASRAIYLATSLRGDVYRQLPRRLEVEALTELLWLNYIEREFSLRPTEGQQRYSVLGALGFRLKPWMRVGANLEREVSRGAEEWEAWRLTTYLLYGSNRFRKLDRPLPR